MSLDLEHRDDLSMPDDDDVQQIIQHDDATLDDASLAIHDDSDHDDHNLALSMPPSDDEGDDDDRLILGSTSSTAPFAPPPHIAARFYRPSHARRRASAASSRRNSMSSAHSHPRSTSSLGGGSTHPGGDQSKHVAQHLRRASFLEDRRARLADRAAHAEKVRLRAAMAKAATRQRDTSLSEERAEAARLARERNLAEIVASCAEEVSKAKLVAESVKERRERSVERMRLQMEERMAEAERRREDLRRAAAAGKNGGTGARVRGHSQSPSKSSTSAAAEAEAEAGAAMAVEEEVPPPRRAVTPLTEPGAAAKIADWWLACRRRRAMRDFHDLGLSVDGIRDTSFDTVTQLLAREEVLVTTARLLRTCGMREGAPGSVGEMSAVRTFLSAFLILGHPNQVLANKTDDQAAAAAASNATAAETGGGDPLAAAHRLPAADLENPQLQDLVGKARDLLVTFEHILVRLTPANRWTVPPAVRRTLPEAYAVFHNAFIAWKSRDSNALIEVMLMQFVELDAIFQTVRDSTADHGGGAAASQLYRQSIQDSQLMLIVRIKKLAGQERGKRLIFDAVAEARRARRAAQRKNARAAGDTKPRVADDAAPPATTGTPATTTATASGPSTASTLLTPPGTPASASTSSQPKQQQQQQQPVIKSGLQGLLPDNRVVVHELSLNKDFQIPPDEYAEQQAALTRPLFEQMRQRMAAREHSNPGADSPEDSAYDFHFFMAVAADIKEKLQRLLKPGNSMYRLIDELLDPDMAQRQFTLGSFSYERFFAAMATMLPKLCAPFRDEQVAALVRGPLRAGGNTDEGGAGDSLADRVEALHGFIHLMLADYINYLLRVAAPGLIESASQYEAKRFAEDFEAGRVGLSAAEGAWRSARDRLCAEAARRDPEGVNHPRSRVTPSRIYAQVLVDVFTQPIGRPGNGSAAAVPLDGVPEMLRLDLPRIEHVSTSLRRIVTAGAVLLQCKNLLKRDVRSPWRPEAARVMAVLEESEAPGAAGTWTLEAKVDATMAALEAGRSMPAATRTHLRALVTKVLAASDEMVNTLPAGGNTASGTSGAAPGGAAVPREPVLRLLHARLRSNMLSRLAPASSSATDKVRAANSAGERLASLGLSEFVDRVRHMVDLLERVGQVDRAAHGAWWDAIATRAEQ